MKSQATKGAKSIIANLFTRIKHWNQAYIV
jgi:hypothetical protein